MRSFLSPLLLAILVVVAVPAAGQDVIHRTQLQIAECRFDMDHDGAFETTYQPQSSNPDCPCFSATAPARAASDPAWPVIGCGGTSPVGPLASVPTTPSVTTGVSSPGVTVLGGAASQFIAAATPTPLGPQDDDGPISDCGPAADGQNQCSPNPTPPCTTYDDVMYRPECHDRLAEVQELIAAALWESDPERAALLAYCAANPQGCTGTGDSDGPLQDLDGDGVHAVSDQNDLDASVGEWN